MVDNNKKLYLKFGFIFIVIILMSYTNAIDTYPLDSNVNLRFRCTLNDQIPSAGTTYNISIFYDKTGAVIVDNEQANALGSGLFNFTQSFNLTGDYQVISLCIDGVNNFSSDGFIHITAGGEELSTDESILYVLLFLFVFFIFSFCTFFAFAIPFKNDRSDEGFILSIAKKKYFKLFAIFGSYASLVWLFNLMLAISINFLPIQQFTGLFTLIFNVMLFMSWPLLLMMIIWAGVTAVKDSNIKEEILRFGKAL